MITVLNSPDSTTITNLKHDITAINNLKSTLADIKIKQQITNIESMINQLV